MSIFVGIIHSFENNKFANEHKKLFCDTLTKMINEFVIPAFGIELKFTIQLGLWTSEQYGSYMIEFYNKENKKVCYILADTIFGEWKCFNLK